MESYTLKFKKSFQLILFLCLSACVGRLDPGTGGSGGGGAAGIPVSLNTASNLNFPSTYLDQGVNYNFDFNDMSSGSASDTGVTYTCVFDRNVDNAVNSGADCSTLSGAISFGSTTGILSWTPDNSIFGPYEFKVTGTSAGGSDSEIWVVDVRPAYITTNLRVDVDAQFATLTAPASADVVWKDLTLNAYDGSLGSSVTWGGTGAYSNPYSSIFDGTANSYIDFGATPMNSQTRLMFSTWLSPTSATSGGTYILGSNDNASGNGFTLRQSKSNTSTLELVVGQSYQDIVLVDSPVGYWRFGESTGTTAKDISGNSNDGTYTNNTLNQTGALTADSHASVRFNGTTSYVLGANSALYDFGANPFSIEFYIKFTTVADTIILAKTEGGGAVNKWMLRYNTGEIQFHFNSPVLGAGENPIQFGWVPTVGQWYHIAVTRSGNNYELYIDGSSVSTGNNAITIPDANFNLTIGQGEGSGYFDGYLDELAIYNTQLSAGQVLAHYNAGAASSGGICYTTSTFSNNIWNYIAGIFDGTNINLYVNGRQECTVASVPAVLEPSTNDLFLGATSAANNRWSGKVSDLKLYTTTGAAVATATDVRTNFNTTADRYRENIIGNTLFTNLVYALDAPNNQRGLAFSGTGCAVTSWFDLSTTATDGVLTNFGGCGATSGWNGTGVAADPYRLTFDATDDYVVLPAAATSGRPQFSIAMWIRTTEAGSHATFSQRPTLIGQSAAGTGDFAITLNGGVLGMWSGLNSGGDNSALSANTINDNVWHHVVATSDGTTVKLYLDGADITTTLAIDSALSATAFYIGALNEMGAANYFSQSEIANVFVYSSALTAGQVSQNCNALKNRFSGAVCN